MQNIQITLVETSHPGNIGAVARAMKTMGLTNLCLVNPKSFPHAEATARAAGADDILANAKVVASLPDALNSINIVFGTSVRQRKVPLELLDSESAAKKIAGTNTKTNIAIVFGRENNGLNNAELALCNYHIYIATDPNFASLNLAAAVQIVAYEIRKNICSMQTENELEELATARDMLLFYQHLESTLNRIHFFGIRTSKKLMRRLQRLFNRAHLEKTEINILRGILTAIDKKATK